MATAALARIKWLLPLGAALLVATVIVSVIFSDALFLLLLVFVTLAWRRLLIFATCVVLSYAAACVLTKSARRALPVILFALALGVVSVSTVLFEAGHQNVIHSTGRWALGSRTYKTRVLAQPSASGELKHIEWDGWGFVEDTTVYLVFDPQNELSLAAQSHKGGKFGGIPCEVPIVHRLESHWYTVVSYTDQTWDRCE